MAMKSPVRQVCKKTSLALMVLGFAAANPAVFAKPAKIAKGFTPQSVLSDVLPGTKRYQKNTMLAQTVSFNQTDSGSANATTVEAIDLTYFDSVDCTGAPSTNGSRQTIANGAFAISLGTPFGLNSLSAFQVGDNAEVAMGGVQSIAVVLKSTDGDVPQSNFSGNNYYCVQNVDCSANSVCTSAAGQQDFELKTTVAIGDPADGGVVACTNGGLNNLIAAKADSSMGIQWGGFGIAVGAGAQSNTDGASNTAVIVSELGTSSNYAARLCDELTQPGGYTSDWFLPAGNNTTASGQLNCLYDNQDAIGGFDNDIYWSSTEFSGDPEVSAWAQGSGNGFQVNGDKNIDYVRVRCVRAFTP